MLQKLYASFSDPTSPYYLAPGEAGPADPNELPPARVYRNPNVGKEQRAQSGHHVPDPVQPSGDMPADLRSKRLREHGEGFDSSRLYAFQEGYYDRESYWDQQIAWGDLDSFRHLNNVRYVRFFESGRMRLTERLGEEVGGPKMAKDMMEGRGVSIILKSIDVRFKRPVTYPDTLMIAHKPHSFTPTQFTLACLAYSYAQKAPVCTAEAVCVWYDYDVWKKCEPPEALVEALKKRANNDWHEPYRDDPDSTSTL